jgi:hypothetical protein
MAILARPAVVSGRTGYYAPEVNADSFVKATLFAGVAIVSLRCEPERLSRIGQAAQTPMRLRVGNRPKDAALTKTVGIAVVERAFLMTDALDAPAPEAAHPRLQARRAFACDGVDPDDSTGILGPGILADIDISLGNQTGQNSADRPHRCHRSHEPAEKRAVD